MYSMQFKKDFPLPFSFFDLFPWNSFHIQKILQIVKLSANAVMNGSNYIQVAESISILIKSDHCKLFGRITRQSQRKGGKYCQTMSNLFILNSGCQQTEYLTTYGMLAFVFEVASVVSICTPSFHNVLYKQILKTSSFNPDQEKPIKSH